MRIKILLAMATTLTSLTFVAPAATVTVTNADDGVSNVGALGTFYWALTNCSPGDTIAFNIPGDGPHYLKEPPNGFPLIHHKSNLTIDGYTQPGSARNTNAITGTNSAVLQIVIDARNGNTRNMEYTTYDGTLAKSDPPINNTFMATELCGYGDDERALLGVYRSTNVNIRGLAFLGGVPNVSGSMKGICFARDYAGDNGIKDRLDYLDGSDAYGHVNGCWFGIDPGNPTVSGLSGYLIAITAYRHRAGGGGRPDLPNIGLIIGVAPGSPNPRAEFNVFAGTGTAFDGECLRTRVCGNFFSVMPDGVTGINLDLLNASGFAQGFQLGIARYDDTLPIVIGTDGDGVNDADEGNLFGPVGPVLFELGGPGAPMIYSYGTGNKPWIVAGNTFGVANDGTVWADNCFSVMKIMMNDGTKVRFGPDFNGVSDALEVNRVYNNHVFSDDYMFGAFNPPGPGNAKDMFAMGCSKNSGGVPTYQPVNPGAFLSLRGNELVNNFPSLNPGDKTAGPYARDELTGLFYTNIWSNYVVFASQTIPVLAPSSISTLNGTCGAGTNGYTNLIVDLYVPDPEGQTNGAKFNLPEFGGTNGWGFVQGKTYLGTFVDNGPFDANPAVGAFSFNISSLHLPAGTNITVAVTYSADAPPKLTGITRTGASTTLTWTGGNGSGTSGFGVQRASSVTGPWATFAFAPTNSITVTDAAATRFYRVQGPGTGMTTLFAKPVTLSP
jgi:hypothetical protein